MKRSEAGSHARGKRATRMSGGKQKRRPGAERTSGGGDDGDNGDDDDDGGDDGWVRGSGSGSAATGAGKRLHGRSTTLTMATDEGDRATTDGERWTSRRPGGESSRGDKAAKRTEQAKPAKRSERNETGFAGRGKEKIATEATSVRHVASYDTDRMRLARGQRGATDMRGAWMDGCDCWPDALLIIVVGFVAVALYSVLVKRPPQSLPNASKTVAEPSPRTG